MYGTFNRSSTKAYGNIVVHVVHGMFISGELLAFMYECKSLSTVGDARLYPCLLLCLVQSTLVRP